MTPEQTSPEGELESRLREHEERMAKIRAKLDHAERFERSERQEKISSGFKLAAIGIGALVLLAGGVWAVTKISNLIPDKDCPAHEHATFRIVVDGQELSFKHPRFDMQSGMPMRSHMHQPDDSKIHLEGGCASVSEFFREIEMTLRRDSLKLDETLHGARELRSAGNATLDFYLYRQVGPNWTWEPFPDLPGHQLRDQQRTLITYGNYTREEISMFQSRVLAITGG